MSQNTWNIDYGPLRGLYRDRESAWVFGICAGIADRFNLRLSTVRVIAVVGLLLVFWLTVAIYIAAMLLIKEKPLLYSGRQTEYEFWRRRSDYWSHQ